ncbi:hypothetical protein [Pseudoduganella chitinolytica]|uniref:Uncharacterized protein n=1 Tax=Pseudoduganella chitinolytica TaxID=34070 RepID=A0ABY8BHX1_9BURK|nr:hypothetical protein [Pseudoduganella chitinolytica]WEF35495.1 hypothetical protein PX653_12320 [Pseudoduganella chitinolytica]
MSYIVRKFSNNWDAIRCHGRLHFIFLYGVVAWGVSTAAISTLLFAFLAPQRPASDFAIIAFSVFPVFGILLAWSTWMRLEQDHPQMN